MKLICYQCGSDSVYTEDYDGIPIGTCPDGHRTGKDLRLGVRRIESSNELMMEWEEAERRAIELLKKAS